MRTVSKGKEGMTTIQIQRDTAKLLQDLGHMGETYDAVIRRLINGARLEGVPHGGREDESARTGDH